MARLLGIDPGLRRVGLAISDPVGIIATPVQIIDRKENSPREIIEELLKEREIEKIVVGYPVPLKTKANQRTRQVDQFIEEHLVGLGLPVVKFNERYSSREAERLKRLRGGSKAGDDEAAALILQHYLDKKRSD